MNRPTSLLDECKRDDFEKFCDLNEIYRGRHHKYPEQYQLYETQLRWTWWKAAHQFNPPVYMTDPTSSLIAIIKQLRSALVDTRAIILDDLGTEIESIEDALEKSKEYDDGK